MWSMAYVYADVAVDAHCLEKKDHLTGQIGDLAK